MASNNQCPPEIFPDGQQLVDTALRLMEIEGFDKEKPTEIEPFKGKNWVYTKVCGKVFILWKRTHHFLQD